MCSDFSFGCITYLKQLLERQCVICYDDYIIHVECGTCHHAVCHPCSIRIHMCPMCRKPYPPKNLVILPMMAGTIIDDVYYV